MGGREMNELLKKRIEEAANDRYTDNTFAYKGFIDGAEYALSRQWISVEDALPKNGENVFAIDSDDDAYVAWFDEMDKTWRDLSDGQFIVPTHWMPIPKFETKK
jgi:hypothetical protein